MWISYEAPAYALFLLAVPVFIVLFILLGRYRQLALREFFNQSEVDAAAGLLRSDLSSTFRAAFFILSYILTALALMEPVLHIVTERPLSGSTVSKADVRRKAHDVVFLLDVSASMGVADGRLKRSRLDYAKELIDEIVSKLHGETVSLYTFTSQVAQVVPGTMDYLYLRMLLRDVELNSTGATGTDFRAALKAVYERFWAHPTQRAITVVILSDGGDTSLEDLAAAARQKAIRQITDELHRHGIVDTIGIGTVEGGEVPGISQKVHSSLNEELLQAIAIAGRGSYYSASELPSADLVDQLVSSLQKVSSTIVQKGVLISGETTETDVTRHPLFQLFVGLAIFFLTLAMILPAGKLILTIAWMMIPLSMHADDTVLEQQSRRAINYMQAQDLDRARGIYQELLVPNLEPWKKNILFYNLGTLFLQQQQWSQAIGWFEKVEQPEQMMREFLERWRFNRALALFGLASMQGSIDTDERMALLEEVLQITSRGTPPSMHRLRTAAKQLLSNLRLQQMRTFLSEDSSLQGIALFWAWATDLQRQLAAIPPTTAQGQVKAFLLSYNQEGEKLKPFWPARLQKLKGLYEVVLTQLTYGSITPLQSPLNRLSAALNRMMQSQKDARGELQRGLLEALAFRPVNLATVKEMQTAVKIDGSAYMELEAANMMAAVNAKDDNMTARYAEEALFWLQEALREQSDPSAKDLLQRAVRQENHAWKLTRTALKQVELEETTRRTQQQILTILPAFIAQVLNQERAGYAAYQCQRLPWQTVLPLFFQGARAAKQAGQTAVSLVSMAADQKEAYRKWSKALEMLSKEQPQQPRSSESNAAQTELPKQIKDLSVQDALRLLQSMQEADRKTQAPAVIKQGPKPW